VVAVRPAVLVSDEKRIRGVYTRQCAIQIATFTFLLLIYLYSFWFSSTFTMRCCCVSGSECLYVKYNSLTFMSIYHDEVEIEDMEYDDDTDMYYYPCPCGDKFQISKVFLI